jgi:hypothetical protein
MDLRSAASATIGLVWASGCSDTSTAPTAPAGAQPRFVRINAQPKDAQLGGGNSSVTKTIQASTGGTIVCGQYTLKIPAGALALNTQIKVSQVSATTMECSLEPTGLTFLRPVTLVFDYQDTDAEDNNDEHDGSQTSSALSALWLNPSSSQWVNIGGTDNRQEEEFSVQLSHFSYYALSK